MTEEFLDAIREKLGVAKKSEHWKHWVSRMDLKTCDECRKMHGKIYSAYDAVSDGPPRHFFCYCQIKPMDTVRAEDSTKQGVNGAPYWLKIYGCLPEYYVSDKMIK